MHFEQYNRDFPGAKKCFIANYKWKKENNWKIKEWTDFSKILQNEAKNQAAIAEVCNLYLAYLNNTISYREIETMNLSNLKSIVDFYDSISKITENYTAYNNSKPCTREKYGKYFIFQYKEIDIYAWMGIYFTDDIGVYIEFQKNWITKNSEVDKKIKQKKEQGTYYYKSDDGNYYYFMLKNNFFEKLCNEKATKEEQQEILANFLEEVIENMKT